MTTLVQESMLIKRFENELQKRQRLLLTEAVLEGVQCNTSQCALRVA